MALFCVADCPRLIMLRWHRKPTSRLLMLLLTTTMVMMMMVDEEWVGGGRGWVR